MFKIIRHLILLFLFLWGLVAYGGLLAAGYYAIVVVVLSINAVWLQAQIIAGAALLFVLSTLLRGLLPGIVLGYKKGRILNWRSIRASLFYRPAFATGLSFFLFSLVNSYVAVSYTAFTVYVKDIFLSGLIPTTLLLIPVFVGVFFAIAFPIIQGFEYVVKHVEKSKQQMLMQVLLVVGFLPWVILFILFSDSIDTFVNSLLDDDPNVRLAIVNLMVGVMWVGWAYELFTGSIFTFVKVQTQKTLSA